MITREQLEEMFAAIRSKAAWNPEDRCVWGYFFADKERLKLENAGTVMKALGYRVVAILEPEEEDDATRDVRFLHVEREEKHTVETLHQRNLELYRLADELGLESYDGMDVGPPRLS